MAKKLNIGWFSFSCSEDSTILFTELLNKHYLEWKRLINFKVFLPLQKKQDMSDIDVSFVEGAITSQKQEEKLKEIRRISKKVIAVGSCAVTGFPAGQRNSFDEKTKSEIAPFLLRFQYAEKVKKIADVVEIDGQVPGCPMNEKIFLEILEKYILEFDVG